MGKARRKESNNNSICKSNRTNKKKPTDNYQLLNYKVFGIDKNIPSDPKGKP